MYIPPYFKEARIEVLHGLIRAQKLAAVVTSGPKGMIASHIPLVLDPNPAPFGTLRGHLARANPQWRDFSPDIPALVIFSGPQSYISPSWYASKQEHGRVVPTWNYAVVHAYGHLALFEDKERLRRNVEDLTRMNEASFPEPWQVDDAPAEYVDGLLAAIIGIEIPIDRLEGKWKMSQNRPAADRTGVVEGLRSVADLVEGVDTQ